VAGVTEAWPLTGRVDELDAFRTVLGRPEARAFVLHGPAGVGKTRLADACRELAASTGSPTVRLVASRSAAALPLGALAPMLPPDVDASVGPAELLTRTEAELARLAGDGRLVVMVDDAHLLDPSSAVLLGQLAHAAHVLLVATIRSGADMPDAVSGWWRDEGVTRIDLQDLDQEATGEVLERALGGPVGRDTVHRLHVASGGNLLLLRELVLEAHRAGELLDSTGAWQVRRQPPARRLRDLLADRLDPLARSQRLLLDTLAVCGTLAPLELGIAEGELDDLEALEQRDLVRTRADGGRLEVALAHPLLGEVLRTELTSLRRRSILLATADRVAELGAQRRDDAFRVATWRLDAGGTPDPALLLQAAAVARFAHDYAAVERLARALSELSPSLEATVLLGEALYELGSFDESEAVLAAPVPPDADPSLLVQRATMRAKNLQWGLSDWPTALQVLRDAVATAGPDHADELLAEEAAVRMFAGQPQDAIDVLEPLVPRTDRVRVMKALTLGPTLAAAGRTSEAVAVASAGYQLHMTLADPQGLAHPGTHIVNQAFALVEAGRFAEAEELATIGHGVAVAERIPIAQIWFALVMARSATVRGHHAEAREWYQEAVSTARVHGFSGPLRIALSGQAATLAVLGRSEEAATLAAEAESFPPYGFLHHDQVIGPAWAAWATGDPARARQLLVAEGEAAEQCGNRCTASWLWYDAARLGERDLGPRMVAVADATDSALLHARAAHVVAIEADDPTRLAQAAEGFETLGMDLPAAEAWWSACDALRRRGEPRQASAADRRAASLAALCQGVRTPGVIRLDTVVPLTTREREVADLASRGLSGPEIAARLFLSSRTVDNHLQKAYAKLGVHGRRELAEALRRT
jgi:DNA-binding CsgD family transcriptional regulator